jgi:hypothetical protein
MPLDIPHFEKSTKYILDDLNDIKGGGEKKQELKNYSNRILKDNTKGHTIEIKNMKSKLTLINNS